jgi:two-component system LytT family sensor kinase
MAVRSSLSWKWILLAATGLGVFSTVLASQLTAMEEGKVLWGRLATLNFGYWYAWALFTPVIAWLANRYRIERGRWPQAAVAHLVGVVVFTAGHVAVLTTTSWWLSMGTSRAYVWSAGFKVTLIQYFDWEMMTYWAIVGLSLAVAYYHEARERALRASQLETRLVEAQLQTLQRQLQPHFLFNTLHAISALMHKDVEQADRMLSRLSELLRLTLDKVGVAEVRVKDEIEFLEKYLLIEQTRLQDRLSVTFEVQPETLDARVPRLILQPLVENAIKHGIAPRPGEGRIAIRVRREGNRLQMEVRDNGDGLSLDALAALQKGVGLSNTHERLKHHYGIDYRFEFCREPGGLTVRVVVPWRVDQPATHLTAGAA